MDLHITNKRGDKTEYYNLTKGHLFHLKEGELVGADVLDKLVLVEIPPNCVAIIKTVPSEEKEHASYAVRDSLLVMKDGLKTSLIKNYREVAFKIVLIFIAAFIFYTHCRSDSDKKPKGFKNLRTLLNDKEVSTNMLFRHSNADLQRIFLEVHKEILTGVRLDYFDNPIKRGFKVFLLDKTKREHLIDKIIQILSFFQPLMDYSLPFLFCDKLYSLKYNKIAPLSFFVGRVLKTLVEQTCYILIFLSLVFLISNGIFTLADLIFLFVYSLLSLSTYCVVSSFIRKQKLFYFLIVCNLYTTLLSYQDTGDYFSIIGKYHRRSWVTKLMSYYFILLPSTNFQAYFYHLCVENQVKLVFGNRYSELVRVQVWGMQTTEFNYLLSLLVLGSVNFFLLVLLAAFNFCSLSAN